ncbi:MULTISPECIES: bifunctional murein DD-endopeptidase/murein LD-carboxypeptidase [Dickeya]|uniref:Bifunctional murein DD-endopeptidase/murein LD-carboxypeptidase n=1 Tax=Dickeya fangzhongdai TaxID=1778540 RepID=A0A2K8QMB2_9GAMM|nr:MULTISPECIES: bifunctional murein DD-endopeptidase/murein LD-carboxypeptidase [Dickeya]ATZ94195.1 bifunctional murein DD-endopeptidase/murein LD-carboxypeptidase [Dickeya fangzhongdai]AYH47873.1 bifunctional murein DD-endopeptidase/murein LD-carboxypeptidase [Dickeya fangzhongdai]MBO8134728.1 bifunctional murein DD-endopeptidase/murein LD-carboxypeptidase [Dickeya fangzhongdai]QOH47630.1 bifunctional murein DD-endopeptidase/murein LD-carboxypeptidase [Dickeya fangzhongdai]QOH51936.1 bifunct
MVKSQPTLRYIWRALPAVAVAVMLSACTNNTASINNQTDRRVVNGGDPSLQASQDEFEAMVRNVEVKSKLLEQYASWKGVRYRLGGDSRKGIDCSGFVQRTFREQFGMDLPRSSYEQQDIGVQIQRNKLRPGDLVVFHAGSTGRHMGIYIGNQQFVHASTSIGVTISSMDDNYWKPRYREARRVLKQDSHS